MPRRNTRGVDWTGPDALVSVHTRVCLPHAHENDVLFSHHPPPPSSVHPPRGSCFFPRARRAPNLNNVGIMQCKFAPAVTRPCATKQGSPVHDLHHAHRVQFIPCKMMPFATFAEPSSAWHITSLPTRPLGSDLHRTTRELAGDGEGIHPVETVISRINAPMHGNNCPSQPLIIPRP